MGEPRDVALRAYRAFEEGDMDAFAALWADDATLQAPGTSLRGREQIRGWYQVFADALSSVSHDFANIVESGTTVVVEGVGHGTHTGPLATPQGEVPPSGREIAIPFAEAFVVEGGLIRDNRFYYDQVGFLVQLGLMPAPAGA